MSATNRLEAAELRPSARDRFAGKRESGICPQLFAEGRNGAGQDRRHRAQLHCQSQRSSCRKRQQICWRFNNFGHIRVDPNADPDCDGRSNLQEFQDGTQPFNSMSAIGFLDR